MVLSLLAPPVLNLCLSDSEAMAIIDISEEEKPDKTEKDKEEKILQWNDIFSNSYSTSKHTKLVAFYLEADYQHSSEIVLPPPEQVL